MSIIWFAIDHYIEGKSFSEGKGRKEEEMSKTFWYLLVHFGRHVENFFHNGINISLIVSAVFNDVQFMFLYRLFSSIFSSYTKKKVLN